MHKAGIWMGLAAAGGMALSGCTTDLSQASPTEQGMIAGAIIGGAIGAMQPGDSTNKAIVGAAAGAVAGGIIGQMLERQQAQLRRDLRDDTQVVNTGESIVVTLSQEVLFDPGSAHVKPEARSELRKLADNLIANPDSTIDIIGHTDNVGPAAENQRLSKQRAEEVRAILVDFGVSPGRLRAYGRGEDEPVASNLTPEGRARNNRVEIVIHPVV